MGKYTHQAFKTYAQAGRELPALPSGTQMPEDYPCVAVMKGANADNMQQLIDAGYTIVSNEEWKTYNDQFKDHPYFVERAAIENAQSEKMNVEALVDRRIAAGLRAKKEITALMDLASNSGNGDPVTNAIKAWSAAGDSDEEQAAKFIALMEGQTNPYAEFSAVMDKVGQKLAEGSLQLAMIELTSGVPNDDLLPNSLKALFGQAKQIIARESVQFYRET